jgi:putative DNA methylase
MTTKKLIEVALPLDDINAASAREKSIRHGHPSTLHLWWARRPLATARAVIWSSLVDDPSSHPEEFPTEEAQAAERERLFDILRELVVWENSNDERVLEAAKAEIQKSCHGDVPALLDPFAGGGAIPLEAQRLGLKAYAQDLNPVAVTINKAMIEIPPRFAGNDPVNPRDRGALSHGTWEGNAGLAADVEYYGNWMRDEAERRIGHLYPKVRVPAEQGGGEATVIAWLWARTVKCPNPACGGTVPLVRSFDLSKKKGKEHHVELACENGEVRFSVAKGKAEREGTVGRSKGAVCPHCGQAMGLDYVKVESKAGRMGAQLMAVVAEGAKGRIYVAPDKAQIAAADVPKPDDYPLGRLAPKFTGGSCVPYGLDEFHKIFTNRQLTALTTFSEVVGEAQERATEDAIAAGMLDDGVGIDDEGRGARAYGEAVGVYLALGIDRLAMTNNSLVRWNSTGQKAQHCFGRQALPMLWDYAECNILGTATGSMDAAVLYSHDALPYLPAGAAEATVRQFDAQSDCGLKNVAVSTDPPYYDNIGYADLSDFFYVWLRLSLRRTYPKLFSTMLVPKAEELVATPYRFDGSVERAKEFFEDGMYSTFQQVFEYAREDVPVTIYYAYKQSEADQSEGDAGVASSGWETMLSAIIRAGFSITGTWPMRTEMKTRMIASGTNALASSIVLVCRKRPADAPMATRREFVSTLKRELRPALDKLQQANIAPVDMAQSAIGPGIGVYSRYSKVLEADGSVMTVRSALQIINQELDLYFSDQDSDLDRESRFCVDLYTQSAFNEIRFGEADVLARAKNTSIEGLAERGALRASKGVVRLLGRDELGSKVDHTFTWLFAQQLAHAMETGGVDACAKLLVNVFDSSAENAKALAYRLFTIADKKGWSQEAFAYNSLVVAWPEIQERAAQLQAQQPVQESLDLGADF